MKTLTIDRSTWLRGRDGDGSCLRDAYGHRCCLGFYLGACGVPDVEITDHGAPSDVPHAIPEEARWLVTHVSRDDLSEAATIDSARCGDLMGVNDCAEVDEEQRERDITDLFAEVGVSVVFLDGTPPGAGEDRGGA